MMQSSFKEDKYEVNEVLTADCAVTWVHPTIFAPSKGRSLAFRFLSKIKPGISIKKTDSHKESRELSSEEGYKSIRGVQEYKRGTRV